MSSKDSCNDLESSNRSLSIKSTSEKEGLKHLDNQVSKGVIWVWFLLHKIARNSALCSLLLLLFV